eukprot:SAG31_NODE_4057_length_3630_cov_3.786746_5_plen_73_part_00
MQQAKSFEEVGAPVVDSVIDGHRGQYRLNAADVAHTSMGTAILAIDSDTIYIFAWGQTGAGETRTMPGDALE